MQVDFCAVSTFAGGTRKFTPILDDGATQDPTAV